MKKTILIITLILLPFSNYYTISQWKTYQTQINEDFVGISILNENTLFVISNNKILKTTNGGMNWVFINLPQGFSNIWLIYAQNENNIWITGGFNNSRIYHTTNGGSNWTEKFYSNPGWIDRIHFFNSSTGFLFKYNDNQTNDFYITRNTGLNWIKSNTIDITGYSDYSDIGFIDTNFIWIKTYYQVTDSIRFFKLTGGLNGVWSKLDFDSYRIQKVAFKDNLNGLAITNDKVIKTTDGGLTWNMQINQGFGPTLIISFKIIKDVNWVISNSINTTKISYDFCQTWQPNYGPGTGNVFRYIDNLDTNAIYMIGTQGKVYKYDHKFIGVKKISLSVPEHYYLSQNYPNPFNPVTNIKFLIPDVKSKLNSEKKDIKLIIYDVLGKDIATLVDSKLLPGEYEISWKATDYPSGVYYYSLILDGIRIETRKMILIK